MGGFLNLHYKLMDINNPKRPLWRRALFPKKQWLRWIVGLLAALGVNVAVAWALHPVTVVQGIVSGFLAAVFYLTYVNPVGKRYQRSEVKRIMFHYGMDIRDWTRLHLEKGHAPTNEEVGDFMDHFIILNYPVLAEKGGFPE